MRYPGGKGGAGVYQTIINLIPPHRRYFELFAGGANVWQRKAPADMSVLVELDASQAARLAAATAARADTIVLHRDALDALHRWRFAPGDFVYLDPPYVHATRSRLNLYGEFELTDEQHIDLIRALDVLGVPFALSGYRSALYDFYAPRYWHRIDFRAMTRGGVRTESLWLNYDPPARLADYGYAGSNFRERERIKRKVARWRTRIAALDPLERAALLTAINGEGT